MSIALVVSDTSLREAIAEGIKISGLGEIKIMNQVVEAVGDPDVAAIVLDQPNPDVYGVKNKTRIFVLGDVDTAWVDHAAVETFPKPCRLGHLLTRIDYHLKTRDQVRGAAVVLGGWRFEAQNRQLVHIGTDEITRLTEKETALLDYLAQSEVPVRREELLTAIWGHDDRIETHTLETHIYQLRRKLGADGERLVNADGQYTLR